MADGRTADPKKSDLGVRTVSAVAMLAVAGVAVWLGGLVWGLFVAVAALGVYIEWCGLAKAIAPGTAGRFGWFVGGLAYIGIAAVMLYLLRALVPLVGSTPLVLLLGGVIATDVGAFFAGRTIGGPKIAPAISPSKTWAGLLGGMVAATALTFAAFSVTDGLTAGPFEKIGIGCGMAIIAQVGDFFESWIKRRAGVKDSGTLIPGHGGLFDRMDGLLAVLFVMGVVSAIATGFTMAAR